MISVQTDQERYDYFANYLKLEHGLGDSSISLYRKSIKRFKVWHEQKSSKPKAWAQFDENDIRAYIMAIEPSPAYANLLTVIFSRFFCFQRDVLKERTDDPSSLIARPKRKHSRPSILEPHEVEKLMSYVYKHSLEALKLRNWSFIGFLYGSGLRISECCGLTMQQIRYQDGLPYAVDVIGKGEKERSVVLNDTAKVALYKWLKHRQKLMFDLPPDTSRFRVWINPMGRYAGRAIQPTAIRTMLSDFGKKALGKNVHPHMLRHSFITQAVRGGAPLHAIQAVAGHADLSTTGRYMHANEADIAGVAASVQDVLLGDARVPDAQLK